MKFKKDDIKGITLLSIEEYEACAELVPRLPYWWWLRSPGYDPYHAATVYYDGSVYSNGNLVNNDAYAVRPALEIANLEPSDLAVGDKIHLFGLDWTVIPETLALCDESIGNHCFRNDFKAPDTNDYEASDIKKFLENWLKERKEVSNEI